MFLVRFVSFSYLYCAHIICTLTSYTHLVQSYSYNCTAPTNKAFNAILDDIPPDANLTDILLYHIDSGAIFSDALFNNLQLKMLNGDDIIITKDETVIKINESNIIPLFDVKACNGAVHTIDKVLIPPTTVTSSPSSNPTQQPTNAPSASPSKAPSMSPSKAPSNAPVKGTVLPTQPPSRDPSASPTTRKPSSSPSESPSSQPSAGPTSSPSKEVNYYCLLFSKESRVYLLTSNTIVTAVISNI